MGIFSGASKNDRQVYKEARAGLERISKRDREETDDFIAANSAVIEAEKKLPWWQR
jgi:hypothetical protein